jgi:hypothetical protein
MRGRGEREREQECRKERHVQLKKRSDSDVVEGARGRESKRWRGGNCDSVKARKPRGREGKSRDGAREQGTTKLVVT